MKVSKLLEALQDCDPDARVILATQSHRPLESHAIGIVQRDEYEDEDECDEGGRKPNDVLILEGDQIGYGNRKAWD
ncbi:hypothetical protein LCGC14_2719230 [marine sediment metagenome]|uniref:Uncharacterized protein n=1 Tax=marine sediment metagenome TaxID=412755 RepID=A0A0F8ZAG8_9ZZZZ